MNEKNPPKAFSIIELSLVLLIVSLLFFGVLAGQNLIINYSLTKARSLTGSSAVGGIEDLAFWFETTSENSFLASEIVNGGTISQWNDINPRLQFKKNLTDSTAGTTNDRPIYTDKIINNLPALYFDGSADFLSRTATGGDMANGNEVTVFLVLNPATPIQDTTPFLWLGGTTSARINMNAPWSNGNIFWDFGICCGGSGRMNTAMPTGFMDSWNIISAIRRPDGTGDISVNNSVIVTSSILSQTISPSESGILYIGTSALSAYFKGYIAEVIVYGRALSAPERSQVTDYLSKKWGIDIL